MNSDSTFQALSQATVGASAQRDGVMHWTPARPRGSAVAYPRTALEIVLLNDLKRFAIDLA